VTVAPALTLNAEMPLAETIVDPVRLAAVNAVPVGLSVFFDTAIAVRSALAAFAGTTDKSPNPSEATATADTFFNEIVFTIFLSFSQIKDDLLSGW